MRALGLLVLAAALLSGCELLERKEGSDGPKSMVTPGAQTEFLRVFPAGRLCGSANCTTVMVTVKAGCAFTVDPEELGMVQGHRNFITWKIDPQSDGSPTFTRRGIDPKHPGPWNREFEREQPGDTEYSWFDTNPHENDPNNRKRRLRYSIHVKQGSAICDKDPIIINDY